MKVEWDYSKLAAAYGSRPPYSEESISALVKVSTVRESDRVCDIGAGTGHLTVALLDHGLKVDAVEPNEAMREIGVERTRDRTVSWSDGVGEATGLPGNFYRLVTFGSSFNVVDQPSALRESYRLLVGGGTFACMWNHRDLSDPLQSAIEDTIRRFIPSYSLGRRREDQRSVIRESGLFGEPLFLEARTSQTVDREVWAQGWRSHATLQRQSGALFDTVVDSIVDLVHEERGPLMVPYNTRIYLAEAQGH